MAKVKKKVLKRDRNKFKTPRAILQHAKDFLTDPNHWAQETLATCVIPGETNEQTPLAKRVQNEGCAYCVLGAIREFTADVGSITEDGIINTPAGSLVELAARDLYADRSDTSLDEIEAEDWGDESIAVEVNDGGKHKTAYGAYRATLRILDRAIAYTENAEKQKAALAKVPG